MKTKPFNLEEALANPGRVICRDGVKPLDLHYFPKSGKWLFNRPENNYLFSVNKNGNYWTQETNACDLLLTCETKLVPWTRETCPLGAEIVNKESGNRYLVARATANSIGVAGAAFSYCELLTHWTMKDGTPCGVEVEE